MEWYFYVALAAAIVVLAVWQYVKSKHDRERNLKKRIRDSWGKFSEREYKEGEFARIPFFYEYAKEHEGLRADSGGAKIPDSEFAESIGKHSDASAMDGAESVGKHLNASAMDGAESVGKHLNASAMDGAESVRKHPGVSAIDDITWNDLDMDDVFAVLNTTESSPGEEVLYDLLRHPVTDMETFEKRRDLIAWLAEHRELDFSLKELFAGLGRTKSISFCEFITRLKDLGNLSNRRSYYCLGALIFCIILVCIRPAVGILPLIFIIGYNVFQYFSQKARVESYFINFRYISALICQGEMVGKLLKNETSSLCGELADEILSYTEKLKPLKKSGRFLESQNVNDTVASLFMSYVYFLTHLDLIHFKKMARLAVDSQDDTLRLFYCLGYVESMVAAASFREALYFSCVPEMMEDESFVRGKDGNPTVGTAREKYKNLTTETAKRKKEDSTDEKKTADENKSERRNFFEARELYHPLLSAPVCNNIRTDGCILLTGSNASGKSTFLKTCALNAILAQTICTVAAEEYRAPFYSIYTSMALRDNITGGESYFVVEIRSLKRILDRAAEGEHILCFIDEVLRGTNTVERVAASKEILKAIADQGILCFAATHDIELTRLLDGPYENYHFQEEIQDGEIVFDYRLREGQASTRNAIRLLKSMGYPEEAVRKAEEAAEKFLKDGVWE
ncbi:MAG: hypothetical protein LUE29_01440 [Lachnospiraceae bacterium]|nr:hypothetical protein [Lachnospiraceae bacterium]